MTGKARCSGLFWLCVAKNGILRGLFEIIVRRWARNFLLEPLVVR